MVDITKEVLVKTKTTIILTTDMQANLLNNIIEKTIKLTSLECSLTHVSLDLLEVTVAMRTQPITNKQITTPPGAILFNLRDIQTETKEEANSEGQRRFMGANSNLEY